MPDSVSKRSVIYEILFDTSKGKATLTDTDKTIQAATTSAKGFNQSLNNFGKTLSSRQLKGGINDLKQGIALLGLENQQLTLGIMKAQGALNLYKAAQTGFNLVVGNSTGVLKGFRVALASTGIGLAIVAIAALVENWDKLKDAVLGTNKELDKFRDAQINATSNQIKILEAQGVKAFEERINNITTEITRLQDKLTQGEGKTSIFNKVFGLSDEEKTQIKTQIASLQSDIEVIRIQAGKFEEESEAKKQRNIKEATLLLYKEGTRDRLNAELDFITTKEKFEIEAAKGNQVEINLIYFKAQQERQKLIDEFNRANRPKEAEITLTAVNSTFITQKDILTDLTDALQKYYDLLNNPPSVEKTDPNKILQENLETAQGWLQASQEIGVAVRQLSDMNQQSYANDANALSDQLERKLITQEQYNEGIDALNKQKAKQDLAFTLAEIAISTGIAIANIIKAATSSSITAFDAAAQIAVGIASVLAGISQATKAVQAAGFAEGTEFVEGKGTDKSDSIPARLSKGEAVITAKQNRKYDGLSKAMLDDDVDNWVKKNYVDPSLAVSAMDNAIKDSRTLDYSERFYRQFLATQEGNYNGKKMTSLLTSIDSKLTNSKYAKWYGRA